MSHRPTSVLTLGMALLFVLSRGPGVPSFHGTFTETGLQPASIHVLGIGVALMTLIVEGIAVVLSAVILARRPRLASARA